MLEFKKTEIEAKIYGVDYKMHRPTVKEQHSYAEEIEKLEGKDQTDALLELLDKCGLPKEVSSSMESDHLLQVVEALMPSKKK